MLGIINPIIATSADKVRGLLSLIKSAMHNIDITDELVQWINSDEFIRSYISYESFLELLLMYYIGILNISALKQGSVEWLANRSKSVGCSELGKLLTPTIASKKILLLSKLGINRMRDGIPQLMWGHAFECTTKTFTEVFFDCKIFECPGSIPHSRLQITCSPDGLGHVRIPKDIVRFLSQRLSVNDLERSRGKLKLNKSYVSDKSLKIYNTIKSINNKIIRGGNYTGDEIVLSYYPRMIALFEFKSPYSRVLGEIPSDYCCQVHGGLDVVPIANLGFYSECRFVNCTIEQFGYNSRYLYFQNNAEFDGEFGITTPLMIGAKFYIMHEHALAYFDEFPIDEDIFITSIYDYQKFGDRLTFGQDYITVDCCFVDDNPIQNAKFLLKFLDEITEIFGDCDANNITEQYITTVADLSNIAAIIDIVKTINPKRVFAVQLWKLMDFSNAYFKRIDGFVDLFANDVKDVTGSVRMLGGMDSDEAESIIGKIPKAARKNADMSAIIAKLIQ